MHAQSRRSLQAAALLALGMLAGCAKEDPEKALRSTFAALQQSLEQRDAGAVADHLAEDFIGNEGLDRYGARRLAAGVFLRNRQVGVTTGPLQVRMQGTNSASVQFDAAVTGGSGGLLPEQGQWYRVETGWRLDEGRWRVVSARWQPRL